MVRGARQPQQPRSRLAPRCGGGWGEPGPGMRRRGGRGPRGSGSGPPGFGGAEPGERGCGVEHWGPLGRGERTLEAGRGARVGAGARA